MTDPTITTRRPVTSCHPRSELPHVPYQGLFREAAYEGGEPYAQGQEEGDEEPLPR
ncbi:hypothetical protein [Streptomyces sp. NPDC056982]|uniref:hypothetical protein n=1 Tax=Streptomyces sp. NPDC056982 TaxID=3345986 RepID=UPI00362D93B5